MHVSLTQFMDFVNANGLKKGTVVANALDPNYEPYKDFYKPLREAIVSIYKNKESIEELSAEGVTTDSKKIKHYNVLIKGYKTWAKKKKIGFIREDPRILELNKLQLSINPELIVKIGKQPTVIKLYFKEPNLIKSSADLIVTLLSAAYSETEEYSNYDFAVLDIRRSRLFRLTPSVDVKKILRALKIEASAWLSYLEQ